MFLDSITVADTPIPAGLPLFASTLAALAFFRRRNAARVGISNEEKVNGKSEPKTPEQSTEA